MAPCEMMERVYKFLQSNFNSACSQLCTRESLFFKYIKHLFKIITVTVYVLFKNISEGCDYNYNLCN